MRAPAAFTFCLFARAAGRPEGLLSPIFLMAAGRFEPPLAPAGRKAAGMALEALGPAQPPGAAPPHAPNIDSGGCMPIAAGGCMPIFCIKVASNCCCICRRACCCPCISGGAFAMFCMTLFCMFFSIISIMAGFGVSSSSSSESSSSSSSSSSSFFSDLFAMVIIACICPIMSGMPPSPPMAGFICCTPVGAPVSVGGAPAMASIAAGRLPAFGFAPPGISPPMPAKEIGANDLKADTSRLFPSLLLASPPSLPKMCDVAAK
mmetsp:Transcript_24301/g.43986  ORF Transcript_24301/g.43986 Transcript_24301/m.43986 type:complete len:262 (-) Transcript_24301:237-1022(-)